MRQSTILLIAILAGAGWWLNKPAEEQEKSPAQTVVTGQYEVVERSFVSATAWRNGFLEVDVDVTFTYQQDPTVKLTLPAFWDGKDASGRDRFTVRFAPTRIGDWSYRTASRQDPSLDGLTGVAGQPEIIRCQPSTNPGFLERTDKYHWKYSNGTRFFPVGTTAYDWIGGQCAEGPALDYFIEFLKDNFNKVRFSYMSGRLADNAFGGRRELSRTKEDGYYWYSDLGLVDSRRINLDHWRKLDLIIRMLRQAGIHAELILARQNPLNQRVQGDWLRGVTAGGGAGVLIGSKGIRYFIGRYAAYSNIWWCIGNEYPEAGLTPEDVSLIGREMARLDPYHHPLSVHWNEDWLFGGESWPTHGILQTHVSDREITGINQNIIQLRNRHGIGFSNDEYGYEDRVKTPNTPETVLKAHRALVLGGGYGAYGHSPTRLTGKYQWAGLDNYWEVQGKAAPPPSSKEEMAGGQEAAPWLSKMRDWMNSGRVGYWRMTPANHLVSGDARNRFCLALEGEEYLVSGEGGKILLDLHAAAGKDLTVEVFDPKIGVLKKLKSSGGAAQYEYSAPLGQFLILHFGAP